MEERYPSSRDIEILVAGSQPDKLAIAILPIGCTEQHGPFLPLETDTIIANGMSESIASCFRESGFPVHVLPAIAYSPTRSNASFPGTVTVGEQAFRDYLSAIVQELLASEFGTIILLSGHGPADPSLRETACVAVDKQFRTAATFLKPVLPISLADASSVMCAHFKDRPGRHADWREFLMLFHLLGQEYFTEDRVHSLQAFQQGNDFDFSTGHVPGVPLEYRSIQGVIGSPLPEGVSDFAEMAGRAWVLLRDRVFAELCVALKNFPRVITGRRYDA